MSKKSLSARVDSKTKNDVESLAKQRDNSTSSMTAQLVRKGLEKETQDIENDVSQNKLSWILLGIGLSFIILYISFPIPNVASVITASIIAGGIVVDNLEAI